MRDEPSLEKILVEMGFGVDLVHYRPPNQPRSPNQPGYISRSTNKYTKRSASETPVTCVNDVADVFWMMNAGWGQRARVHGHGGRGRAGSWNRGWRAAVGNGTVRRRRVRCRRPIRCGG